MSSEAGIELGIYIVNKLQIPVSSKEIAKLAVLYLFVIAIVPLAIDLFEQAGLIIVGVEEVANALWLPTIFAYLPLLILIFIYINASLEPPDRYGLFFTRKRIKTASLLGIISAVVIFVVDIFSGTLEQFGAPASPGIGTAIGFIVAWGILAPFTEELLFRGVIQSSFQRLIESSKFIHPAVFIAVGFEFLWHIGFPLYFGQAAPPGQLFYVVVFGLVSGWLYQKTKSITAPFLVHAIGNIGELLLFWIL